LEKIGVAVLQICFRADRNTDKRTNTQTRPSQYSATATGDGVITDYEMLVVK